MDDSAKHHVRAGATTSHREASVDVSVTHRDTSDGLLLVVQGTVTGAGALDDLGSELEAALDATDGDVTVDLSGVKAWSILAQAMVLNSARRLATRGRQMQLVGASADLRDSSRSLGVFDTAWTRAVRPRTSLD